MKRDDREPINDKNLECIVSLSPYRKLTSNLCSSSGVLPSYFPTLIRPKVNRYERDF